MNFGGKNLSKQNKTEKNKSETLYNQCPCYSGWSTTSAVNSFRFRDLFNKRNADYSIDYPK